jgi:hypothetical protein
MRRTRDFKEFLREKYEGGKAKILHPDPEKRRRRQDRNQDPTIKFWSAMKYDTFKGKVKREFAAWAQEAEAARPRVQPGERITSIDQLRAGDFLSKGWGGKYKVVRVSPRSVVAVEVDNNGRPRSGREKRFNLNRLRRHRMKRIEELKRPDVSFDTAKGYVDSNHGFPPRSVTNQEQYASWLKEKLTQNPRSPFFRLGDEESRHQDQLERHIKKLLEERGVGDDWSWTPPPPVQVGQRVQHPTQLDVGDFVQYYSTKYRIITTEDDHVRGVPVDENGRPTGSGRNFDQNFLRSYTVKRIETVERPDVSLEDAKKYANEKIGFPPRDINTRAKYREWLENAFKTKTDSPYTGLGSDEVEHKNALEKQIKKILEERGVGAGWEWEAPPEAAIGARILDGHQARVGHFIKDSFGYKYKVTEIRDDGRLKGHRVSDNGIPTGGEMELNARNSRFTRIDEIKRPEVTWDKAKQFADIALATPGRSVTSQEKYRKWLEQQLVLNKNSPFYQLADDELEHKEKLQEFVGKLLEERDIGSDWVWTPPPPITFPVSSSWEADHKAILDIAREGTKQGSDEPMGGGVNAPTRRKMKQGDAEQEFVFKARHKEPGQPGSRDYRGGQLTNKTGVPSGQMHNREAGAYALDALLGPGTIVPPTTTTGSGQRGLGAYQQVVPNMFTAGWRDGRAHELQSISNKDLIRHAEVGRLLVLDALMGHQDRHGNNMAFSWKDPQGPKTAENLRIHAIDNGYALADTVAGQSPRSWDIRDNWSSTGSSERSKLLKQFFERIPDHLLEQLQDVTTKDVTKALASVGLTSESAIESVALRLAVLKADPELLGRLIDQKGSVSGQQAFQHMSHHKQKKLLQDAGLPESTLDDIQRDVAEALQDA